MAKDLETQVEALKEELDEAYDKIEDLKDRVEGAKEALSDIAEMAYKAM